MNRSKLNKELQDVKGERDYLKDLLVRVINNQKRSRVLDWINIFCWITCFSLLIYETLNKS